MSLAVACNCPRSALLFVLAFLMVLCPGNTRAQQPEGGSELDQLRRDLRDLRESQETLLKELEELKSTCQREVQDPPAVKNKDVSVNIAGLRSMGSSQAPVVVMAFSGFECSHCAKFALETEPQIKQGYVASGKVRYLFCDFVLETQKNGNFGALAAHCAGDQDKFWEMHDLIFANNGTVPSHKIMSYARQLNLDEAGFQQCLEMGLHKETVKRSVTLGKTLGITGTPTFVIAVPNGKPDEVRVVRMLRGNVSYEAFKEAIDALLDRAAPQ
jgi:protein-disulfide isomerase